MNRLRGWAVTCIVAALGLAASASADDSWVGKRVMVKTAGVTIGNTDDQGRDVEVATLGGMVYTVEEEKGPRIKVHAPGVSGWFAKSDAVLLENAVSYFTDRIRDNPQDDSAYGCRGLWPGRRAENWTRPCPEGLQQGDPAQPESGGVVQGPRQRLVRQEGIRQGHGRLRRGHANNPKYARAFSNRGNAWWGEKKYDKAIADYDEAMQSTPRTMWAIPTRPGG